MTQMPNEQSSTNLSDLPGGAEPVDPAYVIEGQFQDHDWRAIAAKPNRTEAEELVFKAGPREHPWGVHAHREKQDDGTTFIFPSRAAHKAWSPPKEARTDASDGDQAVPAAIESDQQLQAKAGAKGKAETTARTPTSAGSR
jgi:hypothetical protein